MNSPTTKAERLITIAKEIGALKFGEFTLSSGLKSSYYFDGRLLTLHPESVRIVAELFIEQIRNIDPLPEGFGGPAHGAIPIAGALCVLCAQQNIDARAFFVRKERKQYGMGGLIEGHLAPKERVVIIEDAISTGASVISAIEAVQEEGAEVAYVMAILNRNMGGSEELKRRGILLFSILESSSEGVINTKLA